MPAAIPIIALAVTAIGTGYGMHEANDAKQHAAGAAQAEQDTMNSQIADAKKTTDTVNQQKSDQAAGTQTQAIAALRAAMSAGSGMGGTILTGPQGAAAAPTQTKTLLGV